MLFCFFPRHVVAADFSVSVYSMMSDYEVQMIKDNMSEFNVKFHGPKDSKLPPDIKQCLGLCVFLPN